MNKIMEKEWFNGFVANGLQFRLDGYMINDYGVTYHIGVKNISGHLVEIEDRVYFRFNSKKVRKRNELGQYYLLPGGFVPYAEVWESANFLNMQTQQAAFVTKAALMPGEEYLVKIHWNGTKELKQDESYFTECANDILSAHDFHHLELRISNFVQMTIYPSDKENDYSWVISQKEVCENYGMYVPVSSTSK
ncbi:MAG TPA: hypothetical protein DEQ66_00200 [Prevotella sp.]|nr:hypothetical protein [Prevotella sp.]